MISVLFENAGWKLFAVVVAAALWAVVVGGPELTTSISAPIEYQNLPAGLEMSLDTPDHVYLEVQGLRPMLHDSSLSRASVLLNLSSVQTPGERTVTIESRNIDLPEGVRLIRAMPSQLRLRFERQVQADVPVEVRLAAPPPEGYRVSGQQVKPPTVRIIGPESRVRQLTHAETDPVDLSRVVGQAEFRVHVYVGDPHVRLVSSPMVAVSIALSR
jgi:YbbR domain-containing protein